MVIKDTSKIMEKVALATSLSEKEVKEVITHFFTDIRYWMYYPNCANYYVPYLGKFYSTRNNVDNGIKKLISNIRNAETAQEKEELILKLNNLWKYRRLVIQEQELKQYKKRFGKWHWKQQNLTHQ